MLYEVITVQEADDLGNAVIHGPKFEDALISRAASKVIVTAEKIVPRSKIRMRPDQVDIPGFLVSAVVHAPRGAAPCSVEKAYDADTKAIERFKKLKAEEIGIYLNRITSYNVCYTKLLRIRVLASSPRISASDGSRRSPPLSALRSCFRF